MCTGRREVRGNGSERQPLSAFELHFVPNRPRPSICHLSASTLSGGLDLPWYPIGLPTGEDHGFCFDTSRFDVPWMDEAAIRAPRSGTVSSASEPDSPGAGQPVRVEDADCGDYRLIGRAPNQHGHGPLTIPGPGH